MKKSKKKIKKNSKFSDYFLYVCFAVTVFLGINMLLAFLNICYLPPNTTGECVIARNIMSHEYYVLFLAVETLFSALVTIFYLIEAFRNKIMKYKIICFLNILFQPFIILLILKLFEGMIS